MYLVKKFKRYRMAFGGKIRRKKKFPASFLKPLPKPHVSPPKSNHL